MNREEWIAELEEEYNKFGMYFLTDKDMMELIKLLKIGD